MFWSILTHTPLFVWPLLALLIWGGIQSRKTHTVSWRALLFFPMIMLMWSIYDTVSRASVLSVCAWAGSQASGIWLGYLTVCRLPIGFVKERRALVIPGSYIPLILSLSIFALRYSLGVLGALVPDFAGSFSQLALENGASIVSGMFLGRLLCFKLRCKSTA